MTAAHDYEELHHLVDRLSPAQVRRLRLIVANDPELSVAITEPSRPRRSLSFIGTLDAEPDLAERSAELVRRSMGGTE
ncbi:hypothetical protein NLX83_13385 [Allokutzneria sp. A3M-2-11 16]|uniref:hypothetical protein n=1 Tax=Allokutzneria sp. A3M-2-11 16 TaxID=2962043 RepID=UPI0020B6FACE|nr:hypothetical protein [Allokutzneria sp. A3M-2-11 16]MCP3800252.1 hypothetical protein [Allokutzneria sp. A3M-2-11 16]